MFENENFFRYNYTGAFAINPRNGQIYLIDKLEREELEGIRLVVQVTDENGKTNLPQIGQSKKQKTFFQKRKFFSKTKIFYEKQKFFFQKQKNFVKNKKNFLSKRKIFHFYFYFLAYVDIRVIDVNVRN